MAFLFMIIAWLMLVLSTPVWLGKAIYDIIKTDSSFWWIVFSNAGGWVLTIIIGCILMAVATAMNR